MRGWLLLLYFCCVAVQPPISVCSFLFPHSVCPTNTNYIAQKQDASKCHANGVPVRCCRSAQPLAVISSFMDENVLGVRALFCLCACSFFFAICAGLAGWLCTALVLFVMMMMITITIIRNNLNTFVVGNGAPFYSYSTENIFIDGRATKRIEMKKASDWKAGKWEGGERWHIIAVHHQWRRLGIGEWAIWRLLLCYGVWGADWGLSWIRNSRNVVKTSCLSFVLLYIEMPCVCLSYCFVCASISIYKFWSYVWRGFSGWHWLIITVDFLFMFICISLGPTNGFTFSQCSTIYRTKVPKV